MKKPAVFFDRDGVLNIDKDYVYKKEDFEWMPGAIEIIKTLNNRGWLVFVITNQSGVARGFYTEEQVLELHNYMQDQLKANQAKIDRFYYCPHFEHSDIEKYQVVCNCRKPLPGMIEKAFAEWPVDKEKSFVVGDRVTDVEAAKAAGISGYLFKGGRLDEFVLNIINN